jgi:hypothetical protein
MLTPAQLQTLKAHVAANTASVTWLGSPTAINAIPNTGDGNFAIAEWYNQQASPNWTNWRTAVPVEDIEQNGFIWADVDALTVGKARIWDWMRRNGIIRPYKANVRQGIRNAFGNGSNMENAILPHLKTLATNAQKLFATGTGSDATPATPAENVGESVLLSYQDIETARNLT